MKNQVDYELRVDFQKQVENYCMSLGLSSMKNVDESKVAPVTDLNKILESSISKGIEDLSKSNTLNRARNKSISKNTFESLLVQILDSVQDEL
mgnify:CR=1 FL=1